MPLKLSNNAIGTLVSSMTVSGTSVVLAPGQGAKFPALVAGEWFPITVIRANDPTQFEIMHVTARSGDVLTVTRAREGTVAITFSVGDVVEHRLTSGALDRDFVRLGPDSLESVRLNVAADGSNLKATVHADGKEEELARQKDLGTAATRDVVSSNNDTSGGNKVVTQGWMGLGLRTRNDNSNATRFAYFDPDTQPPGYPSGWYGYGAMWSIYHGYSGDVSEFIVTHTNNSTFAFRHSRNGVWREIYHSGNPPATTWASITGKPSTFAPSAHSHTWAQVSDKPSTFAPSAHNHSAENITSGTLPGARMPMTQNAVGTYALVTPSTNGPSDYAPGATVAGSNLRSGGLASFIQVQGSVEFPFDISGGALPGTWRLMSGTAAKGNQNTDIHLRRAALAIRIS